MPSHLISVLLELGCDFELTNFHTITSLSRDPCFSRYIKASSSSPLLLSSSLHLSAFTTFLYSQRSSTWSVLLLLHKSLPPLLFFSSPLLSTSFTSLLSTQSTVFYMVRALLLHKYPLPSPSSPPLLLSTSLFNLHLTSFHTINTFLHGPCFSYCINTLFLSLSLHLSSSSTSVSITSLHHL